ncbi:MAG: hypothetical protein WB492_00510 [Christiangramia sp.]
MRTSLILFCFSLSLFSCQNSDKNSETKDSSKESTEIRKRQYSSSQDKKSNENSEYSKNPNSETNISETNISGTYVNTEHLEDSDCSCYCIDVSDGSTSKLCLTEDNLYINGRFEQNGNDFNVFYTGKASGNIDTEIPWDKFDTGTPIAVLSSTGNGGFKLDWKGFTINGEIAIDYALFGKKTLEGNYKKK